MGLALALSTFSAHAYMDQVERESRYLQFAQDIHFGNPKAAVAITAEEQKLLVDALWDAQEENSPGVMEALATLVTENMPLSEQLRVAVVEHRAGARQDLNALATAVLTALQSDEKLATLVVSLRYDLYAMGLNDLVETAHKLFPEPTGWVAASERPVNDQTALAVDLWNHEPDLSRYQGGAYEKGFKLYMFCRTNRLYACLMTARGADFERVMNADGSLWTQPALVSSSRGLPSYQRNGNTPAGAYHIDGVMPAADQQVSFGKFRRLIIDFVPASAGEVRTKSLLPQSSHEASWWRPAIVARDVGRDLFRIHGTGKLNENPTATWFPFMRTSGCVAQRENTYNGIEYKDQRKLLDTLMEAQNLNVDYANEANLKGLLFIIEVNDEARAVTPADLKRFGIQ
jgi:predicted metal-binding protein